MHSTAENSRCLTAANSPPQETPQTAAKSPALFDFELPTSLTPATPLSTSQLAFEEAFKDFTHMLDCIEGVDAQHKQHIHREMLQLFSVDQSEVHLIDNIHQLSDTLVTLKGQMAAKDEIKKSLEYTVSLQTTYINRLERIVEQVNACHSRISALTECATSMAATKQKAVSILKTIERASEQNAPNDGSGKITEAAGLSHPTLALRNLHPTKLAEIVDNFEALPVGDSLFAKTSENNLVSK